MKADSLQPVAEVLETRIQRKQAEPSPTDNYVYSSNTEFKNDVAPSLVGAAKAVSRRRMSFKLNQALTGRRDYQDLVDNGIVMSEQIASALHAPAQALQERLKERVTEHYLKIKGVLPAKLDLDYALQDVAGSLKQQLQRRPSLVEKDGFLQRVLESVDIDSIGPSNEDEDKLDFQAKRKTVTDKLQRRLSTRASPLELQQRGVIPTDGDYFTDASSAMKLKDHRLRLAKEGLKKRMVNRATPNELVQRGLTREEYLTMDKSEADQAVKVARQQAVRSLSRKLDELYNPFQQLETIGVVPQGYFEQRVLFFFVLLGKKKYICLAKQAEEIRSGHRRQESVVQELHQKLIEKPEYVDVVAQGIVDHLEPEEDGNPSATDGEGWQPDGYDEQSTDESTDDSDEEQRRRLEELERRISKRPAQQELMQKHILYSTEMAPAIQNNAKELQHGLKRRKSIDDIKALGILPTHQHAAVNGATPGSDTQEESPTHARSNETSARKKQIKEQLQTSIET
ncbi:hypothetical protein RFI_30306 [Reticulomyxa filosa]|uniref:Uncharacterized protein n=1 Tax=Reticulomyxa filosa TaxID=46433 RepID=X6M272_RETFI|nr:hypothetical protein RFI_30306 [Reticulomyxa filosa]|eukprot:ETO07085.1 hypothetical protein RFI_30306 [Reticulomyxa filosa]